MILPKIREPTDEQCNAAASVCEEWCKIYPVFFPDKNLTRKMTEWSLVLPWFIREKKELCNKMLRLEQAGRNFTGSLMELSAQKNKYSSNQRDTLMF